MRQSSEQELDRYGVVCLTTANDNILMWSHYAGSHTGICLGYTPSPDAMDFACAFKVRYESVRPQFNMMNSMIEQSVFDALVTKSTDWSYEKEWRLIDHRILERKRTYPPATLVEIIFGCRVSSENKDRIFAAVAGSKSAPNFFIARPSQTHFSLEIDPDFRESSDW